MNDNYVIIVQKEELKKKNNMLIILLAILSTSMSNAETTDQHFHFGGKPDENYHLIPKKIHDQSLIDSLPREFDARERWPECVSLREVRDQGTCGSCWAFGSVEAMTDRICIHSNGRIQKRLSTEEVIGCAIANGCENGSMKDAYEYWVNHGIVTDGCLPYEVPSCMEYNLRNYDCPYKNYDHYPTCKQSCRGGYWTSFIADKSYGLHYDVFEGEQNMMAEIIQNGPITVYINVYSGFSSYKGGVYHVGPNSKRENGHIVKIIGWGEENGEKYWWVANSWGPSWGLGGFMKFAKGVNECGIEDSAIAGFPRLY